VSRIDFANSTDLCDARLLSLFEDGTDGWSVGTLTVRVRYSRGSDFSGTCFYADRRIYINLGRHLTFPYTMATNLAKIKVVRRVWKRPIVIIELRNAYELALFIFMHELYHLLVKRARRNTRQKESMCDRFAARYLVNRFGTIVSDSKRRPIPQESWNFQDLDGFVAAAKDRRQRAKAARLPLAKKTAPQVSQQLLFTE
jgi:hypothetical protein